MGWQFAAFLVGALVLGIVLSHWQNRAYAAELNRMAKAHAGSNLRLVSGRGKGRLRGVVVVLLVDPVKRHIVEASSMQGATVFSRLHHAPRLEGPIREVRTRIGADPKTQTAVNEALGLIPGWSSPATAGAKARQPRLRFSTAVTRQK